MKIQYVSFIFFLLAITTRPTVAWNGDDDKWINELYSKNSAEADQAAVKLYQHGNLSLPQLMKKISDRNSFYNGLIFYDDFESSIPTQISIGNLCLYLIYTIKQKNLFFDKFEVFQKKYGLENAVKSKFLCIKYRTWWLKYKNKLSPYGYIPQNIPSPDEG